MKPSIEISIVKGGASLTLSKNLPSKSDVVPTAFPETLILAPKSVSPVCASLTTPVIVVCASIVALASITNAKKIVFFIMIYIVY